MQTLFPDHPATPACTKDLSKPGPSDVFRGRRDEPYWETYLNHVPGGKRPDDGGTVVVREIARAQWGSTGWTSGGLHHRGMVANNAVVCCLLAMLPSHVVCATFVRPLHVPRT